MLLLDLGFHIMWGNCGQQPSKVLRTQNSNSKHRAQVLELRFRNHELKLETQTQNYELKLRI